ncbi:MAG: Asp-tRNA(Asn)/Glu-tRNA(Gln) amidotransferase A subunit family amidase [Gammaproteobacteria bacterium]|jgi:Asp-tRNA(Asn)/Glu-tRNA(Gln) amidotransferase A subunit family amidase
MNADVKPLPYDPDTTRLPSFHGARERFINGTDTPRDYLERCIDAIDSMEPMVCAFVSTHFAHARDAADAATERYRQGKPLSLIDGMPIGVMDLLDTQDMPTQSNSPIFAGWESHQDAACVYAMRTHGAAIIGKTSTTEFGLATPPGTRNPYDYARSPGGASSGSAAAVGARMVPAALGSQTIGSIVQPAGYCANYAFKPSFGAINRGGGHFPCPSATHIGVHSGTLRDAWELCWFLSRTAGPDAGHTAIAGNSQLAEARMPHRLVRMFTPDWEMTPQSARESFEELLDRLAQAGVEIVEPDSNPQTITLEADFFVAKRMVTDIVAYEMRWPMWTYEDRNENALSARIKEYLNRGRAMSVDDYHRALAWRSAFRTRHSATAGFADGFISLSSPGPAPEGPETAGEPFCQTPDSALGAPVAGLPLLAVSGLPQGVQLMGFPGSDDRTAAHARWICENLLKPTR